jgi:hypothetical protein
LTTYYVRKTGSDSNNGTSAATAFLTIGKALGHTGLTSPVVGGDTVYIGAGTYRETVLVGGGTFTSPASVVQFIGDVDGSHTGDAGEVLWTNFLTDDNTAASNTVTLNFNSRGNLTFDSITIIGGGTGLAISSTGAVANCANVTFKRCFLFSLTSGVVSLTCVTNTSMNWLFERCILISCSSNILALTNPTSTSADYNMGFTVRNCLFIVSSGVQGIVFTGSGAGSFKPGGASIYDCTFWSGTNVVRTATAGGYSTTIPITVYNCAFLNSSANGVNAATSGQIVEDFNYFSSTSPRTNVTAGASSKNGNVLYPGIHMGQEYLYGFIGRPFAMPTIASPLLGFGKSSSVTSPTDDLLGRARPEGGASTSNAIGAFERHDTMVKETSVTHTGGVAGKITGPGSQQFQVAVDASATVLAVYTRFDTNHGTTNRPQMIITNGGECGVADQTITATGAVDTWEQLSTATFTPTAKGSVTVRLVSRSAASSGLAYFDDFTGGATGTQGFDYFTRGEPVAMLVAGGAGGGLKTNPGLQGGMSG